MSNIDRSILRAMFLQLMTVLMFIARHSVAQRESPWEAIKALDEFAETTDEFKLQLKQWADLP